MKTMAKCFYGVPKWRNFDQSGHTVPIVQGYAKSRPQFEEK